MTQPYLLFLLAFPEPDEPQRLLRSKSSDGTRTVRCNGNGFIGAEYHIHGMQKLLLLVIGTL